MTSIDQRLTLPCNVCGQHIGSEDGHLSLSVGDAVRARALMLPAGPLPEDLRAKALSPLDLPRPAEWSLCHDRCEPKEIAASHDYWMPAYECDTYEKLVRITAHLSEKNWLDGTDWSTVLYRILLANGSG